MKTTHETWTDTKTAAIAQLRPAYLDQVERIAKTLRPRFESGELHGWGTDRGPDGGALDPAPLHPVQALEHELEAAHVPDAPTAYLLLACSPAVEGVVDGSTDVVCGVAGECLVIDVYRLARTRGWWKPGPGEYIGHDEWEALQGSDAGAEARS